ncbi:MAG: zf-HC2 domain-containing protein [Pseudomonas sp.]|nr:zf-HC2 domain-containing protein [Pseudomonas sp.]
MHELDCKQCRALLDGYLDQALSASQVAEVDGHLLYCAECAQHLQAGRSLIAAVKAHAHYYPAPADLQGLLARQTPAAWRRWWAPAASGVALAVALVLFIATPVAPPAWQEEAVSSHVRSLMAEHLNDVASADRHTVKPWFTGKLDFAPPVHDFSDQGFVLLGGRLDYLRQRSAAALTYRHDRHVINLFIQPTDEPDSPPQAFSVRGFNVLAWQHQHLRFVAVSDVDAGQLQALGLLVQATP